MKTYKFNEPPNDTTHPLTWNDVKEREGVYEQTGNTQGRVLVLQGEGVYAAVWWHPNRGVVPYVEPRPSIRFRQVYERVCMEVLA